MIQTGLVDIGDRIKDQKDQEDRKDDYEHLFDGPFSHRVFWRFNEGVPKKNRHDYNSFNISLMFL
jgi:hypothetical protein